MSVHVIKKNKNSSSKNLPSNKSVKNSSECHNFVEEFKSSVNNDLNDLYYFNDSLRNSSKFMIKLKIEN